MNKLKQNKFNMKLNKKLFPILLAGFLLVGPAIALTVSAVCSPTCADECAYIGQRQESGDSYRICGNYDSDCCYEWSQWYTNTPTCNPTCADECSYIGQKKCSDFTHTQTCGNYDSDCCFEWSSPQSCGSGQVCQSGTCVTQEVNDPVTGSLTVSSYSVCRGQNISVTLTGQDDNGMVQLKLMVNDGADTYTFDCSGAQDCSHTWSITKSIAGTYKLTAKFFGEKPDGTSEVYSIDNIYIEFKECLPNVDIKANNSDGPISISYNSAATLTWTSTNANSCTASGAWSGTKSTSGSESSGNLTSSKTYTITCTGSGGSASDSVTVNVSQNHPPTANAGPDKEVYETESVILEGSGSDPDGDSITYHWTCNGGTLFDQNVAQPIFYAPIVSGNTTFICTLTVTDSYGASASDSMNVLVKEHHCLTLSVSLSANPNSGCSPLNNVDLTAEVSGTASGEITYFFDCTNDGSWEKTITSGNTIYTASDLCNYSSAGNYTAKVRVQREGLSAENTTQIAVQSCCTAATVNIKANNSDGPITISYNSAANLSWTSQNADSCTASGAWSGTKSISGSESSGNLTSAKSYTITCSNSCGQAADTVTVYIESQPNLSVSLSANPNSGCSPLNDVDLTAQVSGTAADSITYYFDCRNDGSWDKIYTTWSDSYTAYNLCSYSSIGTYTAKVRVEKGELTVEDTVSINSYSCNTYTPTVNIKANGSNGPITIPYNSSADLTWTSENADSCYASNAWSGTKSISGSRSTGNLTSSRTYTITCSGSDGSASDSVTVNVESQVSTDFSIYKTVRSLSRGTAFSDLIYANPKEMLTFGIGIKAGNDPLYNLVVKDFLPSGIIYQGDLRVDDILTTGDIFAGLNIGNLAAGQERRITFRGDVAGAESFSFGQTELTNTASVSSGVDSRSDTAKVVVTRAAVAGAATDVSTGLTNNIFFDSFLLPLMITLLIIWFFKSRIIKFEEWLDLRKKEYQIYKSKKILQIKVAKIKVQELFQKII